jgi:hypothetical protein
MKMNKKFDSSKRRAFIEYCKKNFPQKEWEERNFTSEPCSNNAFYHYYVPYGSHGHFIIQIDISDFKYKEKLFAFGFQYQNESCKLNMLRPGLYYNNSNLEELADLIPVFTQDKYIYKRFNPPKTRAYYSMSKKHCSISTLSDECFSKELFKEFTEAVKIIGKLKIKFQAIGCQFF